MAPATNTPLAYVFGTREHKYLEELLKLLEPFSIGTVYADNHFAYSNKISDRHLVTGKKNTQRMERDHLTLRTRIKKLARKTICFSKDREIHMAVVGTFINLFFFHRHFDASIFYDITESPDKIHENVRKLRKNGIENTAQIIVNIRQSGGGRRLYIQLSTKCEWQRKKALSGHDHF